MRSRMPRRDATAGAKKLFATKIPPETKAQLDALAADAGVSKADWLQELVTREHLKRFGSRV